MKSFHYSIQGTGKYNLVLLNGWGISSKIWCCIIKKLHFIYKFYLIDLPGSGINQHLKAVNLKHFIKILHYILPKKSIILGWSMGGLIASYFALNYPKSVVSIISVSSSPYFLASNKWPGIKNNILENFYLRLKNNYYRTIENFLNLQLIGSKKYQKDVISLKNIIFNQPSPTQKMLEHGFNILKTVDLRKDLKCLKMPFLRIYGSLDTLVPKKISYILDNELPYTESIIIEKSVHAPFISHKDQFCNIVQNFIKKISDNI